MRPHLVSWLDGLLPHSWAALLAPTWFTCVGVAGVLGLLWILRHARRAQLDPARVASVVLWGYLAAVLAGFLVPMLIDTTTHLLARGRLSVRWSGMTSFWGYLAGFAAVLWMTRRHGLGLARFADVVAAPLGGALICCRLGCFLAGCDFGKVTSGPWAMRFPGGSPAWHDHVRAGLLPPGRDASLPVHPTQLYEALLGVAMIAVAALVSRSAWARARAGRAFLVVAATYGLGRIVVEMLRGDAGRGLWAGLSSGQLFSLALLAAVTLALIVQARGTRGGPALPRAAAAAALLLAFGQSEPASAWPAPGLPGQSAPAAPAPTPTPAADEAPISPYGPPGGPGAAGVAPPPGPSPAPSPAPLAAPAGAKMPAGAMPPPPAPGPRTGRPRFEAGVLLGWATPLNRPEGQVDPLAGPTVSLGLALASGLGLWLDFDSLGNRDASHGTLAISAGVMRPRSPRLELGARLGLGYTMVNFDEPAFRDVTGTNVRAEALVNYQLGERWQLWLRPLSFEVLQSSRLGGPIVTWQLRLGVAVRFGERRAVGPASGQPYDPPASPLTGQQPQPPESQPRSRP